MTYKKKTNRNYKSKWSAHKFKMHERKIAQRSISSDEYEWISACKDKLKKEDKAFLSFTDYYNLLIELGYKKEVK